MKEAFINDMRNLWPEGLRPDEKSQWRDIIRVYSMGWCSALISHGDKAKVADWIIEFRPIADLNWWPDNSWKWW